MFRNDYSETCIKEILDKLIALNYEQNVGYGLDKHSVNAEKKILKEFGIKKGNVFFLAGGTQTNMVTISYFLNNYDAVIACDTGHINVHEAGAICGSGISIITCPNVDGKLKAKDIENVLANPRDEHVISPKMVYISDTTETGSVYTKKELQEIRKVCNKYHLILFIDGARLGSALTSKYNDMSKEEFASFADIFYVGGTKNGALFGEALVIALPIDKVAFRRHVKNKGAMLAKGFVLGLEFEVLFTKGKYFELAQHANDMASYIAKHIKNPKVSLASKAYSNQLFIKANVALANDLIDRYGCELWTPDKKEPVIRIVTSFATTEEDVKELVCYINKNK